MRRLIPLFGILLFTVTVLMAQDRTIVTVVPFDGSSLAVNSTNYSATIDLWGYQPFRFTYAMQLCATNSDTTNVGIVAVSYELSNDDLIFPATSNIVTGFSFTNSPAAGGNGFYQFSPGISRYIRFKAIVTTTNCFLKALLAIQ